MSLLFNINNIDTFLVVFVMVRLEEGLNSDPLNKSGSGKKGFRSGKNIRIRQNCGDWFLLAAAGRVTAMTLARVVDWGIRSPGDSPPYSPSLGNESGMFAKRHILTNTKNVFSSYKL